MTECALCSSAQNFLNLSTYRPGVFAPRSANESHDSQQSHVNICVVVGLGESPCATWPVRSLHEPTTVRFACVPATSNARSFAAVDAFHRRSIPPISRK